MANLHLVTGRAGNAHVTAADQGALQSAYFGTGEYVLGKGNKLSASAISNNTVRVLDGDIIMQGRYIRLAEGSYVDLAVDNGTQGMMRKDLIVARYTMVSSVESVNLVVIKGTAAEANPVDPLCTSGDLLEAHDSVHDMPLYRVTLNGLSIASVEALFEVKDRTILDKQDDAKVLTAETAIADGDYFPFYDASAARTKKTLWSNIKAVLGSVFAAKTHSHSAGEVTSGTLPVGRGGTGQSSVEDTTYTNARYRASALMSEEADPSTNGVINWFYE